MNAARWFIIALFLFLWLPAVGFMTGNISFSRPLSETTQLFGPYQWHLDGHGAVRDGFSLQLRIYGRAAIGDDVRHIVILPDFYEWIGTFGEKGATIRPGSVFATQLQTRPFVTVWDVEHDNGLRLHIGSARFNWQFCLWLALVLALPVVFRLWWNVRDASVSSPRERWLRDQAFHDKVRDIEIDFKDKPLALRKRAVLLACGGYAFVFCAVLFLAALGLGMGFVVGTLTRVWLFAVCVAFLPLALAYKMARTLIFHYGGDRGLRLPRAVAPKLFEMLDDISAKSGGAPFSRVFLVPEVNAMVSRASGKLGMFGFGPVTLHVGYALLYVLPPEDVRAIIGHEYGHIAAKDNALGQWVYRIRDVWISMGKTLQKDPLWRVMRLNGLCDWFLKFFKPYSFVLSRQCEYEADAFAARVTDKAHVARALVAINLANRRIRRDFWSFATLLMRTNPAPVSNLYSYMLMGVSGVLGTDGQGDKENMAALETEQTGYDSTHPCVRERVEALGETLAPYKLDMHRSSTFFYFDTALMREVEEKFNRSWMYVYKDQWHATHKQWTDWQISCKSYADIGMENLSHGKLFEFFYAAHGLEKYALARSICAEILKREPKNIYAKVHMLGIGLVHENDASALYKLEELAREHVAYTADADAYAAQYLKAQGRLEEAAVFEFRLREWEYQKQAAEEERARIFPNDVFFPHGVGPDDVSSIVAYFETHSDVVRRVYMVRKEVTYLPEKPMIAIFVVFKGALVLKGEKGMQKIVSKVLQEAQFGPIFRVFIMDGRMPEVVNRIMDVPHARIL